MKKHIKIFFIFFFLSYLIFFKNINDFFVSDDFVLLNQIIKNGPFSILNNVGANFYRPIITISLYIDYKIWGLNPIGYHLTNTFFHVLNGFFVYLISKKLTKNTFTPILSGLIFLTLHAHSESVAWISGRSDLIASFFLITSFYFYFKMKESKKTIYMLISLGLFIINLLSKELGLVYPFMILASEILFFKNFKTSKILKIILPYISINISYLFFRANGISRFVHFNVENNFNFSVINITKNLISYYSRSFVPYMPVKILPIVIAACISIFVIFKLKQSKQKNLKQISLYLLAIFFISTLTVINIGISKTDSQSERFVYFGSIFISILIAELILGLIRNKKNQLIISTMILLFNIILLQRELINWEKASIYTKTFTQNHNEIKNCNNQPDNINGAYIYRNGCIESLELF